jgi:hypothetical protein
MPLWTKPVAGDVLHYRYLWKHEADAKREDGRKTRPCLVLAVRDSAKGLIVHIAPITTRRLDPENSVTIPDAVIRHLGIDSRSLIVTSEYNSFLWIGPDVFPRSDGLVHYGKVPERLHTMVRNAAIAKRAKNIVRSA